MNNMVAILKKGRTNEREAWKEAMLSWIYRKETGKKAEQAPNDFLETLQASELCVLHQIIPCNTGPSASRYFKNMLLEKKVYFPLKSEGLILR